MKTSDAGIALIQKSEGCVLSPYRDAVGFWTVGYGHKMAVPSSDPGYRLGSISQADAECLLATDIGRAERQVLGLLAETVVTQGQFDALVSFVYNLGIESLARSHLLIKLRAGDAPGAADEFLKWDHADGIILGGLAIRRAAERRLFLS